MSVTENLGGADFSVCILHLSDMFRPHFIHRTSLTRIPENGVRLRRKEAHRGTSASPDLRVPRFLPLRLRVYPDGARLRAHGLLPDGHDPEHGRDGFPRPDCARHWHDHAPGVHLLLLIRQH